MTPDEQKRMGQEALSIVSNTAFRHAMDKVADYIESQAISCDPDDSKRAQRIIIAKQIQASFSREIRRIIDNGEVANVRINALEEKKGVINKILRR